MTGVQTCALPISMESPHYHILLVPRIPDIELDVEPDDEDPMDDVVDPAMLGLEWPPSSFVLRVFSSATNRWEERTFFRGGEAAGTVAELGEASWGNKPDAVYWHGALFVRCQKGFVMRYELLTFPIDLDSLPRDVF